MIEPGHIKTRVINEDGTNTFQCGKPAVGKLIISFPDKLFVKRIELSLQHDSIVLAADVVILKSGEYVYDFACTRPLKSGYHTFFSYNDDVANISLHHDYGRGNLNELLTKEHTDDNFYHHVYEAGFRINNTVRLHSISEGSFALKRRRIWPLVALIASWSILVLVAGLGWYYFLPVPLLLLACEQRMTHNAYFASLDNRIFMNEDGEALMEIKPRNGITKFLDSRIRFRIEKRKMVSFSFERKVVHEKWGRVAKDIQQSYGRYLVKLPVVKPSESVKTRFVKGDKLVCKLMLRYPREILPDLIYKLEMNAEYRMN